MKIITAEIKKKTPNLMTQSEAGLENLTFFVKLFTPWSHWTWYIAEANFDTGECFGLIDGFEKELGYFNLNELTEIKGPFGLKIERDRYFKPTLYTNIK